MQLKNDISFGPGSKKAILKHPKSFYDKMQSYYLSCEY